MSIHPTAIVESGAEIATDAVIGPYAIIGQHAKIGSRTFIDAYVRVEGHTTVGSDCTIHQGAVLGKEPQDLKFKNEETYLRIGNGNIIREYVTIHRATGEGNSTVVGDNNFIMAYVHIGHNCSFGSNIIISNATSFAGHIHVEDRAVISGMTGVHQFVRIGSLAMVGGCARIVKDVPPFSTVTSSPARFYGLNVIGLRRNGVSSDIRLNLKRAYAILCKKPRRVAIDEIEATLVKSDELIHLLEFFKSKSIRGVTLRTGRIEKEESLS